MRKIFFTWFLVISLIIGTLAFLYSSPNSPLNPNPPSQITQISSNRPLTGSYNNISAKELNSWLSLKKEILLIDVREPSEFKEGYLKDAVNIPLGQIVSRLQEIPKDKDVVVYCRSGRRSAEASTILVKNGYQRVFNLEGGIMNWSYEVIFVGK